MSRSSPHPPSTFRHGNPGRPSSNPVAPGLLPTLPPPREWSPGAGPVAAPLLLLRGRGPSWGCYLDGEPLEEWQEPRDQGGTDEAQAGGVPLHDDEKTALVVVHVLVDVQDAHDVGAARGLPVVLHLLPGLEAVVQELGAGRHRRSGSQQSPRWCRWPHFAEDVEAQGGLGPAQSHPVCEGQNEEWNPSLMVQ